MSLADWGILAEIVNAIAVVVTLGYLARQISHAKRTAHAQTRDHVVCRHAGI